MPKYARHAGPAVIALMAVTACAARPTIDRELSERILQSGSRNYAAQWEGLVTVPPHLMRRGDLTEVDVHLGRTFSQRQRDRERAERPQFDPIYTASDVRESMYRTARELAYYWCRDPKVVSAEPSSAQWADLTSALGESHIRTAEYRVVLSCTPGEIPIPIAEQRRILPDRQPGNPRIPPAGRLVRGDDLRYGR